MDQSKKQKAVKALVGLQKNIKKADEQLKADLKAVKKDALKRMEEKTDAKEAEQLKNLEAELE